ncbi:MAG: ATPase, T2SS/T4P/T4SS family [Microthrixaceae bacterium]
MPGELPEVLRRRVAERFRSDHGSSGPPETVLRGLIAAESPLLEGPALQRATEGMLAELVGLGPLEDLLSDPAVTDVLVDGPGEVWVDRSTGLRRSGVRIGPAEIHTIVERLVAPLGLRADRSHPVVDARRADGTRVAIVMPPVAPDGPLVALRRHPRRHFALEDFGDAATARLLRSVVQRRLNLVVYGPTGAGKTSLLAALCSEVPADQRVVVVEDTAELSFSGPVLARLEARPPNAEGGDGTDMGRLVRTALRLRPDRIVVGEVRGAEAADMLWALGTGHRGSMSTVHAGTADEALERLELMTVLAGGDSVPLAAVRGQVASAIDVLVGTGRGSDGTRSVTAIHGCGPDGPTGVRRGEP